MQKGPSTINLGNGDEFVFDRYSLLETRGIDFINKLLDAHQQGNAVAARRLFETTPICPVETQAEV